MNLSYKTTNSFSKGAGFSLIEVLVGMMIAGIVIISLYASFSSGFALTEAARENLRATQIMVEKMETIRLYTWDQINTPGFIPATFTNYYAQTGGNTNQGFAFVGRTSIAAAPLTTSYGNDMKMVTIGLSWRNGSVARNRQMTSLVARYGLQAYIY